MTLSISFYRLSEAWHGKMPLLVETVKLLLDERSLGVRKALAEVIRCCVAFSPSSMDKVKTVSVFFSSQMVIVYFIN